MSKATTTKPRPISRRPETSPASQSAPAAAAPAKDHSEKHLIEHLSVGHIFIAFAILTVIIGGIFWSLSLSDEVQNQDRQARAAMQKKEWSNAIKYWEPIIKRYPESPIVNAQIARCYLELNNADQALTHIEAAEKNADQIQNNIPEIKNLNTLHGWAFMAMGNSEAGVQTLLKTLNIDPTYALANYLLADYYMKSGDLKQAGTYFQRLADEPEYQAEIAKYREMVDSQFLTIPEKDLADVPEQGKTNANTQIIQLDIVPVVPQQQ